jgi:hypothetical protein
MNLLIMHLSSLTFYFLLLLSNIFLRNPFLNNLRWRIQFSYLHKHKALMNNTDLFLKHCQRISYPPSYCDPVLHSDDKIWICSLFCLKFICANFTSALFVFFFTVSHKWTSLTQARNIYPVCGFNPAWLSWTSQMAYYRAKLISNGNKAFPCLVHLDYTLHQKREETCTLLGSYAEIGGNFFPWRWDQ